MYLEDSIGVSLIMEKNHERAKVTRKRSFAQASFAESQASSSVSSQTQRSTRPAARTTMSTQPAQAIGMAKVTGKKMAAGKSVRPDDDVQPGHNNSTKRRCVYVLGHSFVRRLSRYAFSQSGHRPRSFNLKDFRVIMRGLSGAHISMLRRFTAGLAMEGSYIFQINQRCDYAHSMK